MEAHRLIIPGTVGDPAPAQLPRATHNESGLVAYRDHKKLTVIVMTPIAGGYRYTLSIGSSIDEPDQTVTGRITFVGTASPSASDAACVAHQRRRPDLVSGMHSLAEFSTARSYAPHT